MAKKIKCLWLCNIMPLFVAKSLGKDGTNKEGWIAGMAAVVSDHDDMELAFAFPYTESIEGTADGMKYYGFVSDSTHPENYDAKLELQLSQICSKYNPDVIHCFGTEYPHTLALLKNDALASKAIIHLQGIMELYADAYYSGLPDCVINRRTFRDWLRHDSIKEQKAKYISRASFEKEVLRLAKNVCGRTDFDRDYAMSVNSIIQYYKLGETLRPQFYEGEWKPDNAKPRSIFVSQGNYPLKGVHFAIEAVGKLKDKYPDIKLYVSGDNITRFATLKDKIKISSYGKYLLELIKKYKLKDNVFFVGQKDADSMKTLFLESSLFLVPSRLENSPNSLGEAMLLGVPCVSARVGGIPSMASDEEVIMYDWDNASMLADSIDRLFGSVKEAAKLGQKGRERGQKNHGREDNYNAMLEMYKSVAQANVDNN